MYINEFCWIGFIVLHRFGGHGDPRELVGSPREADIILTGDPQSPGRGGEGGKSGRQMWGQKEL